MSCTSFFADSDKEISLLSRQLEERVLIRLLILTDDLVLSLTYIGQRDGLPLRSDGKELVEHLLNIPCSAVKTLIYRADHSICQIFLTILEVLPRKSLIRIL